MTVTMAITMVMTTITITMTTITITSTNNSQAQPSTITNCKHQLSRSPSPTITCAAQHWNAVPEGITGHISSVAFGNGMFAVMATSYDLNFNIVSSIWTRYSSLVLSYTCMVLMCVFCEVWMEKNGRRSQEQPILLIFSSRLN